MASSSVIVSALQLRHANRQATTQEQRRPEAARHTYVEISRRPCASLTVKPMLFPPAGTTSHWAQHNQAGPCMYYLYCNVQKARKHRRPELLTCPLAPLYRAKTKKGGVCRSPAGVPTTSTPLPPKCSILARLCLRLEALLSNKAHRLVEFHPAQVIRDGVVG